METKKTKYDTNPLDPDVERKAEDVWGDLGGSAPTQQVGGATRDVGDSANEEARKNVYSEAPTRRIDSPPLEAPYPSIFVPPPYSPPAQYQSRQNVYQAPVSNIPTSRSVLGIGLPEKWAVMLPYAPFYIGLVVSLLELFLVPRKEPKVRFHASQALTLHIAIVIVQTVFSAIGSITGSKLGGMFFSLAAFAFLVISMIRVWKGEPHRIAPLSEPAQWLNDRIEPRNRR
ncbi:MAG TPA: DUF4870 domain-containing protein [Pyrinomonadaceae bacterium]